MRFVPNAVSAKVARQLLITKKHSPALMFGAGIALGITATVKACQSTLKLEGVLNKADAQRQKMAATHAEQPAAYPLADFQSDSRLLRIHTIRDITKLYAVPVCLGVVSIGLLTGAHVVLTKRNVALAAAYAGLDKVFNEYRSRVRKELGDEKDREFRYGIQHKEIVEETGQGHVVETVKRVGLKPGQLSQYAVLFDENNVNWDRRPDYNQTFLMLQQTYANQRLHAKGHVFLNEVYDSLGMPRTPAGQVVGWVLGGNGETTTGDGFIDFGFMDPKTQETLDFMRGDEGAVWLDFNVDGNVYDKI